MGMKKFLIKVIYPFAVVIFLVGLFYPLCQDNGNCDYLKLWILIGIPFGIHKMFFWFIPRGVDIGGTIGILVFNFLIGGVIGGVVLVWRLIVAVCYAVKAVFLGIKRIAGKRIYQ